MRRTSVVVAAALLAQLCLAGDCVDGVTPDCSDAAAQCGPDLDGATLDVTTPIDSATEASTDSAASDGGGDADATTDGDADASDQ